MTVEIPRPPLKGKKALVAGIANEYSIAYGCAKACRELGAELAITYLNDKAKPYVEPLAQALEAPIFMPLDVGQPGPLKTRAASGLKDFDLMLNEAAQRAPLGELVDIMDVGFTCAFLATPYARRLTGSTVHVDGGLNIMA